MGVLTFNLNLPPKQQQRSTPQRVKNQEYWDEQAGCQLNAIHANPQQLIMERLLHPKCGYAFVRIDGQRHLWINPEFVEPPEQHQFGAVVHIFGKPELVVDNAPPKRFRRRLNKKLLDKDPPGKSSTSVLKSKKR